MADFKTVFQKVMGFEGLYSHDPADYGGETYRGISRRFHPSWDGWDLIDSAKRMPGFPDSLRTNVHLANLVVAFYKAEFWDKFAGDDIPDQLVATELFDQIINMSPGRVIEHLQRAINVLNRNQALYPDIVVDGVFGRKTLAALVECLKHRGGKLVANLLNIQQGAYYIRRMEEDPTQERFVGWYERIEIVKG